MKGTVMRSDPISLGQVLPSADAIVGQNLTPEPSVLNPRAGQHEQSGAFLLRSELRRLRRAEHRFPVRDNLGSCESRPQSSPPRPVHHSPGGVRLGRVSSAASWPWLLSSSGFCPHWDSLRVLSSPRLLLWAPSSPGTPSRVPSSGEPPLGSVLTMGSPLGSVLTGSSPLGSVLTGTLWAPASLGAPSGLCPDLAAPPHMVPGRRAPSATLLCGRRGNPKGPGDRARRGRLRLQGPRRCTRALKAHSLPEGKARRPQGVQASVRGRDRTA